MLKQKAGQDKTWWKESVIYQIYPRSFKDSNNDGVGDLPGIIEKLFYLHSLGVTMLWISPFYLSPMADNGYDIANYYSVNPEFGVMGDVDSLIAKAAALGIKIMIDLVVNHTSDEHPWFRQALEDKHSPYRDYYLFRPAINGLPPNNWRSIFGGSAWEKVAGEDMYYLHVFHKKQPDLNWENPQMREDIYQMINWWLEKGVAGFRVDAITFIKKDADYASVPVDGADGLGSIKNKARNRPGIDALLNELKEKTFDIYPCVTVGEAPGVASTEYSQFIGENGYFNMIFDFHAADIDVENGSEWFRRRDWTVTEFRNALFESQTAFAQCGWGTSFIENHDQPRALSKLVHPDYHNDIGAKCLAAMYFFLRGTPFIYQGQELGMTNFCRSDISEFDDISSIDNYHRALAEGFSEQQSLAFVNARSRDNSRTPFPWDDTVNSGFNQGTKPWLPLSAEDGLINAAAQQLDKDSVFAFYQKLIHLRNSSYPDTLIYGDFIPLETASPEIIGYLRRTDNECFISVTNLSNYRVPFILPEGEIIVNNYPQFSSSLKPYQSILIKETNQHE